MARSRMAVAAVVFAAAVIAAASALPGPGPFRQNSQPVAVFLGDSYTVGSWANGSRPFTSLVAQEFGWRDVVLGHGGTGYLRSVRTDSAPLACGLDVCLSYTQMLPEAAALDPQVVVVSGGRNEVSIYPAAWESGVAAFFTALRAALPDATIIATSPLWDDDSAPQRLAAMGDVIRQAVGAIGGVYLDLGAPLLGRPDLLDADGVHPNREGYIAIADAFIGAMRAVG